MARTYAGNSEAKLRLRQLREAAKRAEQEVPQTFSLLFNASQPYLPSHSRAMAGGVTWDEIVPNYPMVRWNRGKYDRAEARARRERCQRHRALKIAVASAAISMIFTASFVAAAWIWVVAYGGS